MMKVAREAVHTLWFIFAAAVVLTCGGICLQRAYEERFSSTTNMLLRWASSTCPTLDVTAEFTRNGRRSAERFLKKMHHKKWSRWILVVVFNTRFHFSSFDFAFCMAGGWTGNSRAVAQAFCRLTGTPKLPTDYPHATTAEPQFPDCSAYIRVFSSDSELTRNTDELLEMQIFFIYIA